MPQVKQSLKLFTNETNLEIKHQIKENFKVNYFYRHSFYRGSTNLAGLASSEADSPKTPSASMG